MKGTMRKAQNTEPESVEENSTGPTRNNSAAAGKINGIESSENPEKMDTDHAEPGKEVVGKEDKEVETRIDAKRDRAQKEDQELETRKDAKRRDRAAKPKEEPKYFEETPNLGKLLDDSMLKYKWSFRNLVEAFENGDEKQEGDEIREESEKHKGILANKEVYLFWCLESQPFTIEHKQQIVIIPAVVAVVLPFPPSDKLVIPLVQNESEDIVPMKKMDWVTYISSENRAALKHLKEDRVTTSPYCLPYYQLLKEQEYFEETEVEIKYPDTKTSIVCSFDWELDELEELTDMLIEEDRLTSDKKEAFKEFVNKKVGEAKEANQQAKDAWKKKASEEMNEETRTALNDMEFYKFYPVHTCDTPDVSLVVSGYINSYYGKAYEIFC